jgi:hypothetical protein
MKPARVRAGPRRTRFLRICAEGDDGLADREGSGAPHPRLDHEPPSAPQVRRGVLEAGNLRAITGNAVNALGEQLPAISWVPRKARRRRDDFGANSR